MRAEMLWAGVEFSALGGRTAALLQSAAEHHLQLRRIRAQAGGFTACCAARHYLRLSRLARHYRVHLRIKRKNGLYFGLRGVLHRTGLWAGAAVFGLLLLYSHQYIWHISYVDLTLGQQTRAAAILRGCGLEEGAHVEPDALTVGETALIETTEEFGWASLNFEGGRLTVEAAPAEPVPEIEQLRRTDIHAKVAGTVVSLDVERGTAAVVPGQEVAAGQVLIAADRKDRKGSPIQGCTAGTVQARFFWTFATEQPLTSRAEIPQFRIESSWRVLCLNRPFTIQPERPNPEGDIVTRQRHGALAFLGLSLPVSFCETEEVAYTAQEISISESLALAKARLAAKRALTQQWPDAVEITAQEQQQTADGVLVYTLTEEIRANICE